MSRQTWIDPPPTEWPVLEHAQRIIDADLSHEGVRVELAERDDLWIGKMWQECAAYKSDVITAIGLSQEQVIRHLAGIIRENRIGGVVS